ncbi:hypothetical protein OU994_14640 [Pseudoduganella sp. SL102]|uniref:hypothetical protein n=1 Tax=Pseudoduganella sp. SL102 TaxID=2995154 RepID=UPI00248B84E8|nr:hypothetical protein [Pseudoduganella sp. SL102]WBS05422.1 hypothetical protein OU994_14640 [Pseudoduganella sp. SL102]
MTQHMTFAAPGRRAWWIIAGVMGGLAGLALDLSAAGAFSGEAARWGGIGALFGVTVGVTSLLRNALQRE